MQTQRLHTHAAHHQNSSSCGRCSALRPFSSLPVSQTHPSRRVVARSGSNGAENGRLTSEKQREIAKILLQTQKNMLELNNSRVKVQEELAMAHRRIADLERELERVRVEQAREQLQKAEQAAVAPAAAPAVAAEQAALAAAAPAAVAAAAAPPAPASPQMQQPQAPVVSPPPSPPPPQQQQQQPPQMQMPPQLMQMQQPQAPQQQQQMQQQQPAPQAQAPPPQQAPPPSPPSPPPPPAPPAVINLTYISGWHNCFIHYTVDGKPWTSVPGQRLTTSKQDHNIKTISIEGKKMEFVMTNGEDDWDSPGRYTDKPKNYAITGPGNYRLKSGKLDQLQ